jgi:hopanoid biosynthesis associated protein HpnK
MPQIILNADDFGRSASINAAVIRAHREGVLTSTSLMVAGDAAAEAIALARATPTLAVGLHLVVECGQAVLPHKEIPHLVDGHGRFPNDPTRTGLRYFLSRTVQRELAREMAAQFDRFAAAGLPFSHVDSHLHTHVNPVIFDLLLPLAESYAAAGLRLPRDDLRLALSYDRGQAGLKIAWAVVFGLLGRRHRRALAARAKGTPTGHHLVVTDRVYGLMQTGQMHEAYVVHLLRRLDVPTAELYFHPAVEQGDEPLGPNPGDLATLLSPAVRRTIQERNLRLTTYPALELSQNAAKTALIHDDR